MTMQTSAKVDPEITYTDEDFQAIAEIAASDAGLTLNESNTALVFSRLVRLVRNQGMTRFADFVAYVRKPESQNARVTMIEAITTHTTKFFRESYHFDILTKDFLSELIERAERGHRLRLWSAGCSSGEEPYSLAATLLAAFPDAGKYDVRILATDINRRILAEAEAGQYPVSAADSVPSTLHSLMFERSSEAGMLTISRRVRELITFRRLNFVEPWPVRGPFDVIFCRNVAIYMDDAVQSQLWHGLESVLAQGGLLCIGHSERVGPEFRNRLISCGHTAYRRA